MAHTQRTESEDYKGTTELRKHFVTRSSGASLGSQSADAGSAAAPSMSRRAAVAGVGMGAAALLCFVLTAGFSHGEGTVSKATAQQVFERRERIQAVKTKTAALPSVKDAERALVTAQVSADQVAELQNDYRYLTPGVAAAGGKLDPDMSLATRRNLTPHFTSSVSQSALGPWFLLASDRDVPAGLGIPMSFNSGFEWVALRPYLVRDDSVVEVTWLAMQKRPAKGHPPEVLAWARAEFDSRHKTFSAVEIGTTATGEALRQEVAR